MWSWGVVYEQGFAGLVRNSIKKKSNLCNSLASHPKHHPFVFWFGGATKPYIEWMSCGQLCVTKAVVTCDAASFQTNLINTAVQSVIVFNPAFYPAILFGGYLGSISGRGRPYTLSAASLSAVESSQRLQFTGHRIFFPPGLKCPGCEAWSVKREVTTNLHQLRFFCPAVMLIQVCLFKYRYCSYSCNKTNQMH